MRKITLFLLFFLVLVLSGLASASAEKKYLNIGGDPVTKDVCKKKGLKTFLLPEDAFVATTGKSRKVYVGWMREGEEIGWLNKEQTEYVVCRCGNSVKFLQSPQEIEQPKVEKILSEPEPELKIESEPKPEPVAPVVEKKKKKIIILARTPEPVYVPFPVERPSSYFVDYGWGWGYSGGYAIGGRVIRGGHHRDRHRHDNYRHDRYQPPRSHAHSRGGPGPDPPN